jgi:AcrR family transcriptional regulator
MLSAENFMSLHSADPRRHSVLLGAFHVFTRYGYQRTSMADIASAAKLSRPALYLLYKNKADVFCSLAQSLFTQALQAAQSAWPAQADPISGLSAAILAKDLPFFQLLKMSPHGAEIIATGESLSAALVRDYEARFALLVTERLEPFGPLETIERLARLLSSACHGLKHTAHDEEDFKQSVALLARLLIEGLRTRS